MSNKLNQIEESNSFFIKQVSQLKEQIEVFENLEKDKKSLIQITDDYTSDFQQNKISQIQFNNLEQNIINQKEQIAKLEIDNQCLSKKLEDIMIELEKDIEINNKDSVSLTLIKLILR